MQKPLADLLRPESISEMVGQHHLLDEGSVFRKSIEANHLTNMVFYGPPGVGKTTLANIIAKNSKLSLYHHYHYNLKLPLIHYLYINLMARMPQLMTSRLSLKKRIVS